MAKSSIRPAVIIMFNYVIIPTIVDWFSYFERFERKSRRHQINLFKHFIILIIASVFIPITGQDTIDAFLDTIMKQSGLDVLKHSVLSTSYLKSSDYFLRYLVQCTFLTNMIAFLDLPHFFYVKIKNAFSKYSDDL